MNSKWLTNPFHFVAGGTALAAGVGAILVAAAICTLAGVHFDGIIDAHYGPKTFFPITAAEGFINFLVMTAVLTPVAYLIGRPGFRIIDLIGTQALARAPFVLLALVMLAGKSMGLEQVSLALAEGTKPSAPDLALLMGSGLLTLLTVGLAVYWMYRSFAICTHTSGTKTIAWFVGALVLGEVLSKIVLHQFYAVALA